MWKEEPHPGKRILLYLALAFEILKEVPDAWKVMFWLTTAA